MLKKLLPLIVLPTLVGCGNAGYSPPPEIPPITETVVEKSFDETWRDLLFVAVDNSFRISKLNRDAGRMILRLDSRTPGITPVLDCGAFDDRPAEVPDVAVELEIHAASLDDHRTRIGLMTTARVRKTDPENLAPTLEVLKYSPPVFAYFVITAPIRAIGSGMATKTTCLPTNVAAHKIVDRISERDVLGPPGREVAEKLANWATELHRGHKGHIAQLFFDESLLMYDQILATDNSEVVPGLIRYAESKRQPAEAEALYRRILEVQEKALGPDHASLVPTLDAQASLYGEMKRYDEAEALLLRALEISEGVFEVGHPKIDLALHNLTKLYRDQGRYADVEEQYKRALELGERVLGINHVGLLSVLVPLADLYDEQRRFVEAHPLYLRVLTLCAKKHGVSESDAGMIINPCRSSILDSEQKARRKSP